MRDKIKWVRTLEERRHAALGTPGYDQATEAIRLLLEYMYSDLFEACAVLKDVLVYDERVKRAIKDGNETEHVQANHELNETIAEAKEVLTRLGCYDSRYELLAPEE